jgi:hypothetical protein
MVVTRSCAVLVKGYKLPDIRQISFGDILYSMVTVGSKNVIKFAKK